MKRRISIYKLSSVALSTRPLADEFFNKIKKYREDELTVDFKNVEFMSRSFADQYIRLKSEDNYKIKEINKNEEVKEILEFVEAVRSSKKREKIIEIKYKVRKLPAV